MEQFEFVEYISCSECTKKLTRYQSALNLTFVNQRNRLSRCKACPNLASTLEKLNKKVTVVPDES